MQYDVIIIGGGHNGLTAAGYLAAAGKKVIVLERRDRIGGAAVTTEFAPGYRNSEFSYVVSLLDNGVTRDLELKRHGLDVITREGASVTVAEDEVLWLPRETDDCIREIRRFSEKDAEAYRRFDDILEEVADVIRPLTRTTPYNLPQSLFSQFGDAWRTGRLFSSLSLDNRTNLAELMTKSVADYLDQWFESDILKGTLAYSGCVGNFAPPSHSSTAYVLLHHVFGKANEKTGAWGHARGGMGAITDAMASSATERGVEIRMNAEVKGAEIADNRITGVKLADGEVVKAKVVLANCHPQILLGGHGEDGIVDETLLPQDLNRRIKQYRSESGSFRMNLALDKLPQFSSLKNLSSDPELVLNGSVNVMPSIPYIQKAYDDAIQYGWSRKPVIEMSIPSIIDDSLAPKGHHVMSLFCQHFRRHLPDGRSWDDAKDEAAETVINTVDALAPGFKDSIVGTQINSPLDLERKLNLIGGDIFHGQLHLDQIYAMRPVVGVANYRMPVKGLYLGGSGAHPGGGVSGLPGRNSAKAVLKDWRSLR